MKDVDVTAKQSTITIPDPTSTSLAIGQTKRLRNCLLWPFRVVWTNLRQFFRFLLSTRRRRPIPVKYESNDIDLENQRAQRHADKLSPRKIELNFQSSNLGVQVLLNWCVNEFEKIKRSRKLSTEDIEVKSNEIRRVLSIIHDTLTPIDLDNIQNRAEKTQILQDFLQFQAFFQRVEPILKSKHQNNWCLTSCKTIFRPITGILLLVLLPLVFVCAIPLSLMKINLLYTMDMFTRSHEEVMKDKMVGEHDRCLIFCCSSQCCPDDQRAEFDCSCGPGCSSMPTTEIPGPMECCDYYRRLCCSSNSSDSESYTASYGEESHRSSRDLSSTSFDEHRAPYVSHDEINKQKETNENNKSSSKLAYIDE